MKMEGKVYSQSVHDKGCNGCSRFQSDVMITFLTSKGGEFYDFFLSDDQAEILIKDIQKTIDRNRKIKREEKKAKMWYNQAIGFVKQVYKSKFNSSLR